MDEVQPFRFDKSAEVWNFLMELGSAEDLDRVACSICVVDLTFMLCSFLMFFSLWMNNYFFITLCGL